MLDNEPRFTQKVMKSGLALVRIPAGSFEAGSEEEEQLGLKKRHLVRVPSFYMAKYEITNKDFEKFSPGHKRSESTPGDMNPVSDVSLKDAMAYAAWLSKIDDVPYSIPTEDQWEYVARDGHKGWSYPWGNNFDSSKCLAGGLRAKNVGSYEPTSTGVHDICGNVGELTTPSGTSPNDDNGSESSLITVRGLGVGVFQPQIWFPLPFTPSGRLPGVGFRLIVNKPELGGH